MAILSKSGQLLANASQRTVVFDTLAEVEAFKAGLPEGVNVNESFDIYVKENATVYAAGHAFKMREVVADADINVYFSTDGTGDGKTPETPANLDNFFPLMSSYSARYDFNNFALNLHFAPGKYRGISFFWNFMNCANIVIMGENPIVLKENGEIQEGIVPVFTNNLGTAKFSGATINIGVGGNYELRQIGIENGEGAVLARDGANVTINDVAIQWLQFGTMNTATPRGIVTASDPGTIVGIMSLMPCFNASYCEPYLAGVAEQPSLIPDDAFFLAENSGTIMLYFNANTFVDDRSGKRGYFMGREAVFKAQNNGIVNLAGNKTRLIHPIDDGVPLSKAKKPECGWLKLVTGGIAKISNSYDFGPVGDVVCDATAIIQDFEDINP